MGLTFSDLYNLHTNPCIRKFIDEVNIDVNDPFWNQLLSFPYVPNYSKNELEMINAAILPSLSTFSKELQNCLNLIEILIVRSDELKSSIDCASIFDKDSIFLKQFYNGLFIFRNLLKFFIENKVLLFIDANYSLLRKLIKTLISVSVEIPLLETTFIIHLEIVTIFNLIIYSDLILDSSKLSLIFFDESCLSYSTSFLRKLFEYITKSFSIPGYEKFRFESASVTKSASYTDSLLGLISLGYYSSRAEDTNHDNFLCSHSVFFILKLYIISKSKSTYRDSLFAIIESGKDKSKSPNLELPLSDLLEVLNKNFEQDHFILLFYLLFYKCRNFRTFVFNRDSFANLVVPLLKIIYNYSSANSNHVYMALITLLIFTENNTFNTTVHREMIYSLPWITEKTLTNISVGSLTVYIICRTIQFNLVNIGDRYIHTNCLAALANMSSKFVNLHSQSCEQMIVLLILLKKRKATLLKSLKKQTDDSSINENTNLSNNLSVIDEVLQMLLEIINSALVFSMTNNHFLVHTLLYHRKEFTPLKECSNTQTYACNIDSVLAFFLSKIEKELGKSASSQTEILNVIKKYSPILNKFNNFKKFAELKFKYIEEEAAEDFFLPYIWKVFSTKIGVYSC